MLGPDLSMVLTCIINGFYNYPVHACTAGVECLVCLFVHHISACLRVQDSFKGSLYTQQVVQVKIVVCRWSTLDRNGLEARKNTGSDTTLNVAFISALVHIHSLVTLDPLFSTFKGSRILNILATSFFPGLAIAASSFPK